jgi:uncharacterized protein (DUF2344 family)
LPNGQEINDHDSVWPKFEEWLTSLELLLWISGKAGSGKSTLIQFLHQEQLKNKLLSDILKDENLTVAVFFFVGSSKHVLQKSRQGMLRSLLHQILKDERSFIRKAFLMSLGPTCLSPSFLDWTSLQKALEQVLGV